MTLYKFTDEFNKSYKGCQWGENVTNEADGKGRAWVHAYIDPLLAVFLIPMHDMYDLKTARLWECDGEIIENNGLHIRCKKLTTVKRISIPEVSTKQRKQFATLISLEILRDKKELNLEGIKLVELALNVNKTIDRKWIERSVAWVANTSIRIKKLDLVSIAYEAVKFA